MRQQAMKVLRSHGGKTRDSRLELIALTLRGGAKSFEKVIAMIDEMVGILGEEQASDDKKKAYCLEALDTAEDEKKVLDQQSADLEKAIDEAKEAIATLTEEIASLADGIKELDKQVAKATSMREEEHTEYTETM